MPQPNFESSEWKDEEFDPPELESWYGEGAVECSDVFDIHVTLQANYYRAERRANGILEQDDLDITAVREYLSSIYEQASLGYVEEDNTSPGRSPHAEQDGNDRLFDVIDRLPKYDEFNRATDTQPRKLSRFLELLSRTRPRFI